MRIKPILVAAIAWGTLGLLNAEVEIADWRSAKVLYDFDETAEFTARIKSSESCPASAQLTIRSGVDQEQSLPPISVELRGNESVPVTLRYPVGRREYGHAAYLTIRDASGRELAKTAPEIFEVCHDWRKIKRAGSIPAYFGIFDPASPRGSAAFRRQMTDFCREFGYNTMHIFGSWWYPIGDLTPQSERWNFWTEEEPAGGNARREAKIERDLVKEWVKHFHANGIKCTMYMHTILYPVNDETAVFDAKSGKRFHDPRENAMRRASLDARGIGVPQAGFFAEDFGKKLAANILEYDFDGLFADDFDTLIRFTANGVDRTGKKLTDRTFQQLYFETLSKLAAHAGSAKDNFVIHPNGLHGMLNIAEQFPARDMFGPGGETFPAILCAGMPNITMAGEWRAILKQANTPWQFGRSQRAVRELMRMPSDLVLTIACPPPWAKNDSWAHGANSEYTFRPETVLPFTALVLSGGHSYNEYYSGMPQGVWTDTRQTEVARRRAEYLRFAGRYGACLYDLESRWTPRGVVEVQAPGHVYWKGNTYRKDREFYVHLINFDKPYLYAPLWDRERKVPPIAREIKVKIKLAPGEEPEGAWSVSPDRNGGESEQLKFTCSGDTLTVSAPDLEYWNLIVVRLREKGGKP